MPSNYALQPQTYGQTPHLSPIKAFLNLGVPGKGYLSNQTGVRPISAKAESRPRLRKPVMRSENKQA